jgi:hypothetical protein
MMYGMEEKRNACGIFMGNLRGKKKFEDLDLDGLVIKMKFK